MNCLYCGAVTNAEYSHFHGSVSKFCKYTRCRMSYQNFMTRLKKNQSNQSPVVSGFANLAYTKTVIQQNPAMMWDRQLIFIRKYENLFITAKS